MHDLAEVLLDMHVVVHHDEHVVALLDVHAVVLQNAHVGDIDFVQALRDADAVDIDLVIALQDCRMEVLQDVHAVGMDQMVILQHDHVVCMDHLGVLHDAHAEYTGQVVALQDFGLGHMVLGAVLQSAYGPDPLVVVLHDEHAGDMDLTDDRTHLGLREMRPDRLLEVLEHSGEENGVDLHMGRSLHVADPREHQGKSS